jgi:hypothetical protein
MTASWSNADAVLKALRAADQTLADTLDRIDDKLEDTTEDTLLHRAR